MARRIAIGGMEARRTPGALAYTTQRLLFPKVRKLGELFTSIRVRLDADRQEQPIVYNGLEVSLYCSTPSHKSLSVEPTKELIAALRDSMIIVGGGIYFKITTRDDGLSLVSAQYQHIIGSRYIALIKTLPRMAK